MKRLPAPSKIEPVQPTEVWSPSQGGQEMLIGCHGFENGGTHRSDRVAWFHSEPFNHYQTAHGMVCYPRNPVGCRHYKKRFAAGVWICAECGSRQV